MTLIERAALGGVCVHAGCIPSACFHRSAEVAAEAASSHQFGLAPLQARLEWARVLDWASATVREAAGQVRTALQSAGVEVVPGGARLTGPQELDSGGRTFAGVPIVLATGAASFAPTLPGAPGVPVLSNDGAMALDSVPGSIIVAGGGRFSLEWADLFNAAGARVTLVSPDARVLPAEDEDIAGYLQVLLDERGVEFLLGAAIEAVEGDTVVVQGRRIATEAVLCADSRMPNIEGLGLEAAGVELSVEGGIKADADGRTAVAGVFAAGDVTGPPWLSNRARAMGVAAAQTALGQPARVRYERIPRSVNTRPELAAVGSTEAEAVASGRQVGVGYGELVTNLRALTLGEPKGALKLVVDAEYGEILGAHMVGAGAVEVIAQVATAMELEADYRDLARVHHLHPSLAELVTEAAKSCQPSTLLAATQLS